MPDFRDKIVEYVKQKGPVLPSQISKTLNKDTMFAGAVLSELVSKKLIMVTNARIGASPLYYSQGQEEKLQILKDHLPMREKEAFDILKEKQVVADDAVEPAHRVALSNLKDFASPIVVKHNDQERKFWKWYLLDNNQMEQMIKSYLEPIIQPMIPVEQEILELPKPVEESKEKPVEIQLVQIQPLQVQHIQEDSQPLQIQPLTIEKKPKVKSIKSHKEENFTKKAEQYLSSKNITIIEKEIIRKNQDIEFKVNIPSDIGNLEYFVKSINKKRINETDLILAYSKSQDKNLPCLLLTDGKLTNKANKYFNKKLKGIMNIIFYK